MSYERNEIENKCVDFGVVTFFSSNNYGAVLQAYALQKRIISLGYSAEIINCKSAEGMVESKEKNPPLKTYFRLLKTLRFNPKSYLKARSAYAKSMKAFDEFRTEFVNVGKDVPYDREDFERVGGKYRAIISGSDMVWTDKGQDMDIFLLRFVEKRRRLSYAASLTGTEGLTNEKRDMLKRYISEFERVSCRESEGVEFAKESGIDAFLALDPTLLLKKSEWKKQLSLEDKEENYILCYCFGKPSPGFKNKVNRLAKKKKLNVKYISLSLETIAEDIRNNNSGIYGPREFVETFFNAKFIITNTYHGLLFSLIGEKPFVLLRREEGCKWKKNEERMQHILRVIGEEKRYISSLEGVEDSFFDIDYNKIGGVFDAKREESVSYLEKMLEYASKYEREAVQEAVPETVADISAKKCTGCAACFGLCPAGAIEMKADDEGFLKPVVNSEKCTGCSLCVGNCPALQRVDRGYPEKGYTGFSKESLSQKSASGGAFITFAKYVIEKLGGVVFGCVLDKDTFECLHKRAETLEELYPMQNSKYVQSDVSGCYEQLKKDLEEGRTVLFSGTPCQIAGVKAFLGKEYDGLMTVDIICHGVPSPKLWKKEIDMRRARLSRKILEVTFRNKDNEEQLRSAYEITVRTADGKSEKVKSWNNAYFKAFLNGESYRRACYYCQYANLERCGDITIGDCDSWRRYLDFYPEKTKSSILINSKRGAELWTKTQDLFEFVELDIEEEQKVNSQLAYPTPMPKRRESIFSDAESMDWPDFEKKYCRKRSRLKDVATKFVLKIVK